MLIAILIVGSFSILLIVCLYYERKIRKGSEKCAIAQRGKGIVQPPKT